VSYGHILDVLEHLCGWINRRQYSSFSIRDRHAQIVEGVPRARVLVFDLAATITVRAEHTIYKTLASAGWTGNRARSKATVPTARAANAVAPVAQNAAYNSAAGSENCD
jgi:hypothetical protein